MEEKQMLAELVNQFAMMFGYGLLIVFVCAFAFIIYASIKKAEANSYATLYWQKKDGSVIPVPTKRRK